MGLRPGAGRGEEVRGMKRPLLVVGVLILALVLPGCAAGPSTTSTGSAMSKTTETAGAIGGESTTTTAAVTVWETVRYEQNSPGLKYSGSWTYSSSALASKGSFVYTGSAGASVTIRFVGTYLGWLAKTADVYGKAKVTVDDASAVTVDLYSKDRVWRHIVWETKTLPFGPHTVKIACAGKKRAAATGTYINVDAIEVVGAVIAGYQQGDPHFAYSGKWKTVKDKSASGGSFALVKSSGSFMTVAFTGVQIDWFAKVGPPYGKASVAVDGADPIIVDLYSAEVQWAQRVWSSGRLPLATHEVKIRWTGMKDPEATGTYINVDAFEIAGILAEAKGGR